MTDTATFDVFCPGMLEVLSIGRGDLKIVIGDSDDDRDRARDLIEEMMRKGYTVFVEDPADHVQVRASGFDPHAMEYIITGPPALPAAAEPAALPPAPADRQKTRKRAPTRRVPVVGTRATAVGRTAGG